MNQSRTASPRPITVRTDTATHRNARLLRAVTDDYATAVRHEPWCDPTWHHGGTCACARIDLRRPHAPSRRTAPVGVQLVSAGYATRARLELSDGQVLELDLEAAAALATALDSLMMTAAGQAAKAAAPAANVAAINCTRPTEALAGV